jgi:hypothetical protein
MPPGLLDSQLDALEEPRQALTVDVSLSPSEIVRCVRTELGLGPGRTAAGAARGVCGTEPAAVGGARSRDLGRR